MSGSPRRKGNTEILLDKALDGCQGEGGEVEKIILNELHIKPCQECGGCDKTGVCVIKDDMQMLHSKFKAIDGIVLASPLFFGSLSAQTKIMIDRCQALWVTKYILKNPIGKKDKRAGAFISVGGMDREDFFNNAKMIVKNFFATIDVTYFNDLYYPKIDAKGDILKHPKADEALNLGKQLMKYLKGKGLEGEVKK